jgi:hypothetical protein
LREKRGRGIPLQRVRILEHVRGNKWKAEWIDPHAGLVDYLESGQLIVPWKEHKSFLREEADKERLEAHNESHGYRRDSPVDRALHQVFESTADELRYDRGVVWGATQAVERMHLTLKKEATKPAASNVLQQQARFDESRLLLLGDSRIATRHCHANQRDFSYGSGPSSRPIYNSPSHTQGPTR